jgi:O-antigen/teichoic acid export membrane protein
MLCCRIVIMLSIIACLFILVFSRPLVATLFSAEFLPVIPLLFILTPGIIIRCAGKSLFPYFNGINRPGVVSVATILNLAVNILLLVILLPKWGLPGAAWATTSGYVVSSLYLFVAFISFSKMSIWKMLLIQTSDFRLVGSSFVKREKMI